MLDDFFIVSLDVTHSALYLSTFKKSDEASEFLR